MKFLKPLLFLLLLLVLVSKQLFAAPPVYKYVQIKKIQGSVFVNGKAITEKNLTIQVKDRIKVEGPNSYVILRYPNGAHLLLKEGEGVAQNVSVSKSIFNLIKGSVFSFVEKTKKNAKNFEVHTPITSFGVRGTKFFISHKDEGSYLCVCEGGVEVKNSKGHKKIVKRGEDLTIKKPSDTLIISKANSDMLSMALDGFKLMGLPVVD